MPLSEKPQTSTPEHLDWHGLMGYEKWQQTLPEALNRDVFPPALLLEGRQGLGKRLFAAQIAAMMVCQLNSGCGQCSRCKQVHQQNDPDVFWLDSQGQTIKAQDISTLEQHLYSRPLSYRGATARVAVIVDAERMSLSAMNRILKILEEPPQQGIFILTTSQPGLLIDTILSRVVRLKIKPPSPGQTIKWLHDQGYNQATAEELDTVLKIAGYAPGAALRILEAKGDDFVIMEQLAAALSSESIAAILQLVEAHVKKTKIKPDHLLNLMEVALNQHYRGFTSQQLNASHNAPPPEALRQRRKLLRRAKSLAIRGKVALNAPLLAEAWALAGFDYRR